jgi:hypothetical protein
MAVFESVSGSIQTLNGSPRYLGTISAAAATAVNNKTTASAFGLTQGKSLLLIVTGSAGWLLAATSQAVQASKTGAVSPSVPTDQDDNNPVISTTGANAVDVAVGDKFLVTLAVNEDLMQVVGNGGTCAVKVFELRSVK